MLQKFYKINLKIYFGFTSLKVYIFQKERGSEYDVNDENIKSLKPSYTLALLTFN